MSCCWGELGILMCSIFSSTGQERSDFIDFSFWSLDSHCGRLVRNYWFTPDLNRDNWLTPRTVPFESQYPQITTCKVNQLTF